MVRSVEDASILMGVISDIDMQGCDLNIATCLENRVSGSQLWKKTELTYDLDCRNLKLEF